MGKLNKLIKYLILLAIVANAVGMFFPILTSTFSPYYGSIAKHIAQTNNWSDLILSGHDWMDKPHLPFWLVAISFKIWGINSFAYILPGFLFHLLGIYYTYRLARFWYSKEVGLLAALFTATSLHLMLSSIDVRAEAYLLGEIMPACYYWLKYDKEAKFKYLLLGAIFTAFALMTKGVFILITIYSGLVCLWMVRGQWRNFISLKWIIALVLSFILIFPELMALYYQFDLHPEKVVFGNTHMSGIYWYFWASQFGRFFNTGPIMSSNPPPLHQLYFVHTFLWAYLPWWPMFVAAVYTMGKTGKMVVKRKIVLTNTMVSKSEFLRCSDPDIYFLACFFITFILFSITKFQVDHYTNIIFPFASIISAAWFSRLINSSRSSKPCLEKREASYNNNDSHCKEDKYKNNTNNKNNKNNIPIIFYIESGIAFLLLGLMLGVSTVILTGVALVMVEFAIILSIFVILFMSRYNWVIKTIAYPTIAMSVLFIFAMVVNGVGYAKYDAGYQIAKFLNRQSHQEKVVGYKIDLLSLDFYSKNPYVLLDNLAIARQEAVPAYLIVKQDQLPDIRANFAHAQVIKQFGGCSIETYLRNVIQPEQLHNKLTQYVVIKINQ